MIIVTGGAGFVGSNIVAALNERGEKDILVVDHLRDGHKMRNLADLDISDYMDREDFAEYLKAGKSFGKVAAVFHQGACSATTEWDGKFVMRNNFAYSKLLLHWCQDQAAQFIYASSASVYGLGTNGFREDRACELPINMYAYSKFQFDQYVRKLQSELRYQCVGLRYFNVYGPREQHKGSMASTALHFHNQLAASGVARLFAGTDGIADGGQRRDFVYVEDCAKVNLWFLDNPGKVGIFNLGTGVPRSFNDMAKAVIACVSHGSIKYIPFPDHLVGSYQTFTQAELSALRNAGYRERFHSLEEGISKYSSWLTR